MKLFRYSNLHSRLAGVALFATSVVAGLSSCDAFHETLEPCPRGVVLRFVYDYNLEFANAFPSQVDCLTLLVYNSDGRFVTSRTETTAALADEDYRMTIDLPEGEYRFVAYGGMECDESSFHFVTKPTDGTTLTDLKVELNEQCLSHPVGTSLHPLFYGDLQLEVEAGSTDYTAGTVPMMKDTNNLRVLLQHLDGSPVYADDFTFTVTDNNTLFDWDNSLLEAPTVNYWAWTSGEVSVGENPDKTDALVAFAEMSFPRLMVNADPRLIIRKKGEEREVVNIPLDNYLLALKSELLKMGAQEFLDRGNQWSMIFFLNARDKWTQVQIQIADWTVRINNSNLS